MIRLCYWRLIIFTLSVKRLYVSLKRRKCLLGTGGSKISFRYDVCGTRKALWQNKNLELAYFSPPPSLPTDRRSAGELTQSALTYSRTPSANHHIKSSLIIVFSDNSLTIQIRIAFTSMQTPTTPALADEIYISESGLTARCLPYDSIQEVELIIPLPRNPSEWIRATLSVPKSSAQSSAHPEVTVVCHGMCSWRNQILLESISRRLSAASSAPVATLRFDFRGNGASSSAWSYDNSESLDLDDLKTALAYLKSNDYTVTRLVGHSQACRTLLKYYSTEPEPPALCVLLSGRFYPVPTPKGRFTDEQIRLLDDEGSFLWFKRGVREFVVAKEACERRADMDIPGLVKTINSRHPSVKFTVIHGSDDTTVPVEDGRAFNDAIDDCRYLEIEGANHGFNGTKHLEVLVAKIIEY